MRVPKFLSKIATNVSNNGLFSGIATFPGFLLPEAVASAIADIEQDSEKAWQETRDTYNIFNPRMGFQLMGNFILILG